MRQIKVVTEYVAENNNNTNIVKKIIYRDGSITMGDFGEEIAFLINSVGFKKMFITPSTEIIK